MSILTCVRHPQHTVREASTHDAVNASSYLYIPLVLLSVYIRPLLFSHVLSV